MRCLEKVNSKKASFEATVCQVSVTVTVMLMMQ